MWSGVFQASAFGAAFCARSVRAGVYVRPPLLWAPLPVEGDPDREDPAGARRPLVELQVAQRLLPALQGAPPHDLEA